MFEIGWTEMLVIAVVMIVVVGPKDLPKMLRAFGRTTAKMRSMAGDFQKQFNEAMREAELDEVKKSVDSLKNLNPTSEIRKQFNPFEKAAADVRAGLDTAMKPTPKPAEPQAAAPLKGGATAMPAGTEAKPAAPTAAPAAAAPAAVTAAPAAAVPDPSAPPAHVPAKTPVSPAATNPAPAKQPATRAARKKTPAASGATATTKAKAAPKAAASAGPKTGAAAAKTGAAGTKAGSSRKTKTSGSAS